MESVVRNLRENFDITIDKIYIKQAEDNIRLLHNKDDGFICIAEKNKDKLWAQYHYTYKDLIENIGKIISLETNVYISPNSFYRPFRRIENIRHLNSLYIDIDYYKIESLKNMNHKDVMDKIYKKYFETDILPKPSFALFTGNGLAYYWLIEPCPVKVLPLWNVCQQFFVEQLEEVGGDKNSIDSARVMKIAGSFHTKMKSRAELYIFDEDLIYNLGDIQKDYLPELSPNKESVGDRVHKRKHLTSEEYFEKMQKYAIKHSKGKKQSKVLKLYNQLNLHYTRLMDIVKLQEMRGGRCRNSKGELVDTGEREFMCFLYRYWYCLYSYDIEQALECTKQFNNNFLNPLSDFEVEKITVSAVKAYEEWKADDNIKNDPSMTNEQKAELMGKAIGDKKYYHKGYNYNNSTLIKKLHITEEEQKELKTIISKSERKRRQLLREKENRRNSDGLTPKQAEKMKRLEKVQELFEQGYRQKEIAEKLNITKYKVSRDLKEIKEKLLKANEEAVS